MFDGVVNKKSGIIVINLPYINCTSYHATHDGEKKFIYPEQTSWCSIDSRAEYENRYPYLPDRIIDNLLKANMKISIIPWGKLTADNLRFLIEATFQDIKYCEYDLSRKMRRANYNPQ